MNDLSERLFNFAVRVIKYVKTLNKTPENKIVIYQIVKSSTSSGANYEEAQGASSRADFSNKVNISLKEMRESNYWLRIIKATNDCDPHEIEYLITESDELKKILGSITSKTRKRD